jgi:hypothetical protein
MSRKPKRFGVTFLPPSVQKDMEEKHGDLWMDHDPEWYFESKEFDSFEDANKFAQANAGPFTQVFERTNIRREDLIWEWDEKPIED